MNQNKTLVRVQTGILCGTIILTGAISNSASAAVLNSGNDGSTLLQLFGYFLAAGVFITGIGVLVWGRVQQGEKSKPSEIVIECSKKAA
ncbi:MAG: hypothetical protein C5B54_01195 [Acidobacteria bacterium]|nr:MAG: hypothetical protein C5B54_01195 [Acidobacteriota bacterium]